MAHCGQTYRVCKLVYCGIQANERSSAILSIISSQTLAANGDAPRTNTCRGCTSSHRQPSLNRQHPLQGYARIASFTFPLRIMSLFLRTRSGFALANSGFAFERTTVFRCDIASEGTTAFRSETVPLIARRRRDFLNLMLSAVCCNKFLTL